MLEKLEIIISLIAGIIILIMGLIYRTLLTELLIKLLITMVVFYLIGLLVKKYFLKNVFNEEEGQGEISEDNKEDNGGKSDKRKPADNNNTGNGDGAEEL